MCSTEHGSPVPLDRLEDEITTLAGHLNAATCRWLSCAAAQLDVANRAHTGRHLVYYHDDDGSLVIEARLPVDEGELVLAALTAAGEGAERRPPAAATMAARATATTPATATMAATATATATLAGPTARVSADAPSPCADTDRPCAAPAGNVSAETPSPPQARADALVALAEATLEHTPSPRAGGARHEVLLLVDHETLRGDAPGRCGVGDGESLAPETARRLACDASVVPIRTRSGRPLDVGRRTRSIPTNIRRALTARDGGCGFPGCGQRRFVDAHHIVHWSRGGTTDLSNLVLLCRHHHRLLHEGGCSVRPRAGGLAFHRPGGRRILDRHRSPTGDGDHVSPAGPSLGLGIDAETTIPRWAGDPLDAGLTTELLLWRAEHRREPAAANRPPAHATV